MLDRPQGGERSVLVHLGIGQPVDPAETEEFRLLARAAGAEILGLLQGSRSAPEPRLFLGTGKADELRSLIQATGAELVLFNHSLTPAQERNLERHLQCRVLDRTGLILDIFAQRARSSEGKLQVELAQLRHLSSRLVRGWTHLERQKGGIGLRGPGETQLETDRRLLGARISLLKKRLARIASQRALSRRARARADLPTLSLVGYTNAGKSTLFNRLTQAHTYEADQLFATLDPLLRRWSLSAQQAVILADTVGFINHLPHELIAAFRATLEETRQAALLLHVVDATSPRRAGCIQDVETVLQEIGAEAPQLQVFNKIDQLPDCPPRIERDAAGRVRRVWLSARTGAGLDLLRAALVEHCQQAQIQRRITLSAGEGKLRAWFFRHGQVVRESFDAQGRWHLEVCLSQEALGRLRAQYPQLASRFSRTQFAQS